MININLNLLSNQKKDKLKYLIRFIFSKFILEIVLFVTALMAIALVWSWMILQDGFTSLAVSSSLVNEEYVNYNKEIKKLNTLINNINKTTAEYEPTLPKIIDFSNNLPANIKLTSFYLDKKTYTLQISGVALTRQDLVDYQTKLKELLWTEGFNTPVSKLFQKDNISFEFKTNLKNIKRVK